MHIIGLIIAALSTLAIWLYRARAARDTAVDLFDAANDARLAARRFGFRRKANTNPIDSIEDPRLAAAGILVLAAQVDGSMSKAEEGVFTTMVTRQFRCSGQDAAEFLSFGRWIAHQGKNPDESFRRLTKRVKDLGGPEALNDLGQMVQAMGQADKGEILPAIEDMLHRIKVAQGTNQR